MPTTVYARATIESYTYLQYNKLTILGVESVTERATVNWRTREKIAQTLEKIFGDLKRLLFQLSINRVAEKLILLLNVFFSVVY